MSTAAQDRQKLLLQQEIAKLSGAITRHATNPHPSAYHPYRGSSSRGGSSSSRGASSSQRGFNRGSGLKSSRGRGRGGRAQGAYTLDLRQPRAGSSNAAGSLAATATPSPSGIAPVASAALADDGQGEGWVKSKGGMSLMTAEKRKQLASAKPKRLPKPQIQLLQSTSTGEGKRVVIDGVVFQFEQDGRKLTRVGASTSSPTRHSVEYGGEKFRRTKRGNLVSRPSLIASRAEQASMPCRYYTKTGRCQRALTCPYRHDPDRLAICPRFLRNACPLGAAACPLSHVPSAHNTPSCVHFQATATCRNGAACVYPHVRVAPDAPVCEAFARGGWCDKPAGTCGELHVWECPEWRASGTCKRGSKCGLPHVLRAEHGKADKAAAARSAEKPEATAAAAGEEIEEGAFEDQAEFIGLGPGEPSDYSDESDSDEGEEGGEGEDEEEDDGEVVEADDDEQQPGAGGQEASSDVAMADTAAQSVLVAPGKSASSPAPMDTDDDDEAEVLVAV